MVQRKVPSKVGIQDDHIKSDKRVLNLKPSCSQHQDGRSRGTDMKKKLKKARSINLSDIESLTPSPVRHEVAQPGKPPPMPRNTAVVAAIHNKQAVNKTSDGSPNYMKPTTSSEARKEQSQVSSRSSQTISNSKSRRSTNYSKQFVKQLARSTSLKLVRTLTKTPSFKLARPSSKKCCRVVLCADMDVQRATCSSTMKDSKFPVFLELNPGGTEAEGTSVLKVCPYTYCSLNGHHHPPLPPLKCFVAARRRLLKTQKSTSLECLSPRRIKLSEAKDDEILVGVDEVQEEELHNTVIPAIIRDENEDFFIEVYAKERAEMGEVIVNESSEDVAEAKADDDQVAESVSDEQLCSEIDYEDDLDINVDDGLTDLAETEAFSEKEGDSLSSSDQDKIESGGELECKTGVQWDESDFEACDMEWEEAPFSNSIIERETDIAVQIGKISDVKVGQPEESANMNFAKESIFETHGVKSNSFDENSADDLQQEGPEEDASWVSNFSDIDYEDYAQVHSSLDSNSQNQMPSSAHDEAEESMAKENKNCKIDNFSDSTAALSTVEEPMSVTIEDYFSELVHSTDAAEVTFINQQQDAETEQVLQDTTAEKGVEEEEEVLKADKEEMHGEHDKSYETETIEDPKLDTTYDGQSQTVGETEENHYFGNAEQFNSMDDQTVSMKFNKSSSWTRSNANQEDPTACNRLKLIIGSKRLPEDSDEQRKFNPKEPNYLPVQPDPEAEKVDLKHQMVDDRKNAEEWMVDFALQRAVNQLATARKKKVSILVEAFEKVIPAPKHENRLKNPSAAFTHARTIQACS